MKYPANLSRWFKSSHEYQLREVCSVFADSLWYILAGFRSDREYNSCCFNCYKSKSLRVLLSLFHHTDFRHLHDAIHIFSKYTRFCHHFQLIKKPLSCWRSLSIVKHYVQSLLIRPKSSFAGFNLRAPTRTGIGLTTWLHVFSHPLSFGFHLLRSSRWAISIVSSWSSPLWLLPGWTLLTSGTLPHSNKAFSTYWW